MRAALHRQRLQEIDQERGTYSRCDYQGCADYQANFTPSGTFTVIDLPGTGTMAKLSDARQHHPRGAIYLVEVVTMGVGVAVSYGTCYPVE